MTYKLQNVRMCGNEHGQLRKNLLYAELVDSNGDVSIMATLDYILAAIRDRGLIVEGVTVHTEEQRGEMCSEIRLDFYG